MTNPLTYNCYGLNIASELALPELIETESAVDPAKADVRIRIGTISPDGLPDGQQLGPFLWASPDQLCLHVPKVARFLVSGGDSIVIEPTAGIDEDSVRVFLLGSAIGALLFQRGYLVLHGNAIRIGDQCMVCVGHSGAGKSSLCLKCGLCCNGALHAYTRLRPSDVEPARRLGLIVDANQGRPEFRQPCTLYRDERCSAYPAHPHTCQVYECAVLKSYRANAITFDESIERIERAKALLADVVARLPVGYSVE